MQVSIIIIVCIEQLIFLVSDSSANTAIIGLGTVLGLLLIVLVFSITLNIYCAITKQVEMITVIVLIINIHYKCCFDVHIIKFLSFLC